MTTTTPKTTTASKANGDDQIDAEGENRVAHAAGVARQAVMDAAATAGPKLADAADSAGAAATVAVREADRLVTTSSDQTLRLAGAFAIGSALGLLIGGGNRRAHHGLRPDHDRDRGRGRRPRRDGRREARLTRGGASAGQQRFPAEAIDRRPGSAGTAPRSHRPSARRRSGPGRRP